MTEEPSTRDEVRSAHRYFSSFSADYHEAFAGRGENPLHRTINVLFRRKTFQKRTAIVRGFLEAHGVAGKRVLDLGCGSGEVSLVAARLGAQVTGLDLVEEMVATARREAAAAGLADRTQFQVAELHSTTLPASDVTLIVSVLEYYKDIGPLLKKICDATGELLILVDTRGPWWRRLLRHALARLKGFRVYYRSAEDFGSVVTAAGFSETVRVRGHSFWALAYRRVR